MVRLNLVVDAVRSEVPVEPHAVVVVRADRSHVAWVPTNDGPNRTVVL